MNKRDYEIAVLAEDWAVKYRKFKALGEVDWTKLQPIAAIQAHIDYHLDDAQQREAFLRLEIAKRTIRL